MSLESAPFLLDASYARAIGGAPDRATRSGVKRAFRAAYRALASGDVGPTILLAARWP
jgi:hypothetical protein